MAAWTRTESFCGVPSPLPQFEEPRVSIGLVPCEKFEGGAEPPSVRESAHTPLPFASTCCRCHVWRVHTACANGLASWAPLGAGECASNECVDVCRGVTCKFDALAPPAMSGRVSSDVGWGLSACPHAVLDASRRPMPPCVCSPRHGASPAEAGPVLLSVGGQDATPAHELECENLALPGDDAPLCCGDLETHYAAACVPNCAALHAVDQLVENVVTSTENPAAPAAEGMPPSLLSAAQKSAAWVRDRAQEIVTLRIKHDGPPRPKSEGQVSLAVAASV